MIFQQVGDRLVMSSGVKGHVLHTATVGWLDGRILSRVVIDMIKSLALTVIPTL